MSQSSSFRKNRLRVLMYHKTIDHGNTDLLTVSKEQLEQQFQLLLREGYNCVALQDVLNHISTGSPLKKNPVILTFDDGYKNNYTVLYPMLQKYNLKAVIFLVPGFIEKAETGNSEEYMDIKEIKSMDPGIVEFGLHTFDHKSYNELEPGDIEKDIIKSKEWFKTFEINYLPAHAYTFGNYPKSNKSKRMAIFSLFKKYGIQAAFNIGNRVNALPLKNNFVIQRIDVRGTDSLSQFSSKVKNGKVLTGLIKDLLGKP